MATLSLCLIVGNVEEYIERCLESFAPIADEICIVRAIGAAPPDATLDLAAKFGARVAEYHNAPANADWPHLDSFAAARNQSFDMATGDFLFWCDTDDILESGAELIREHVQRGGYPSFVFPYKIFGKGVSINRDRMIARGAARWVHPVHETFEFTISPVSAIEDQRIVITHLPHMSKTGSNERNLRILRSIPESEMNCGLWYHLHGELIGQNDIPGAIEAAKKALASPDIGRPEAYEIYINLASHCKAPAQKEAFLHQAYQADPTRRWALALLACNAMNFQRPALALTYARQMMATPRPERLDWNDREASYGWFGDEVMQQALRCNDRFADAERLRRAGFEKYGKPRIALLHATRGRFEKAAQARKMWLDLAERPDLIEHIFLMDDDDPESEPLRRMHHLTIPAGGGCVAAWNQGIFANESPVFVQMSDDWIPPLRWDEQILARLGDLDKPSVLAVSDGIRTDKLICMAICTRKYLVQDGFFFHPRFKGVFSDNWFTEQAYARGAVIEARDLVFTHEHPLATGKTLDQTYEIQNSTERYAQGRRVLEDLRLGRDWSSVPGFLDYWMFYQTIANRLKDGDTVAEIGVWLGRSIIFLAQVLQAQRKKVILIAVDTFRGESNQPAHAGTIEAHGGSIRAQFEANIARCGVASMIKIIECDSALAAGQLADASLDFCFVDAAHDYESVHRDITAWLPKMKPGAILAGHDICWPDVRRAVGELCPKFKVIDNVWANL